MKPLPRSASISGFYRGVRIYRDDLERIIGLLRDTNLTIKITDDSFEYETLEDLQRTRGNTPRVLRIDAQRSSGLGAMSLSMSDRMWHLYSYAEQSYEPAREIEAILKARQSSLEVIPIGWIVGIGIVITTLTGQLKDLPVWLVLTLGVIGTVMLLFAGGLWLYSHFRTGVVLGYRHEAGFFARNCDNIFLLMIGATVGASYNQKVWKEEVGRRTLS